MRILVEIIKGMIIGVANVIPGLSGGTIAVSMGIYEKLIYAINNVFKSPIKCLKDIWGYIIGIAIGVVIGVVGVVYLLNYAPVVTTMLFVGLILGAIPTITKKVEGDKVGLINWFVFFFFIAIIMLMPFLQGKEVTIMSNDFLSYLVLFGLGALSATTMVIPGVSGSMMLMALGYYAYIMGVIDMVIKQIITLDISTVIDKIIILIPFGIGIIVGIVVVARIIGWLLKKHEKIAYWGILGLIVASPFPVIYKMDLIGVDVLTVLIATLAFIVGIYSTKKLASIKE